MSLTHASQVMGTAKMVSNAGTVIVRFADFVARKMDTEFFVLGIWSLDNMVTVFCRFEIRRRSAGASLVGRRAIMVGSRA